MKRLKELRLESNLTQEEFRTLFNRKYNRSYTPAAISMFETGRRTPEISALADIADFFKVSIDYLMDLSDIKEFKPIPENSKFEELKKIFPNIMQILILYGFHGKEKITPEREKLIARIVEAAIKDE